MIDIINKLSQATRRSIPGAIFAGLGALTLSILGASAFAAVGLPWQIALLLVLVQALLWSELRNRKGPIWKMRLLFWVILVFNVSSTAAGIVAQFPDRLGSKMIIAQLGPGQRQIERRVGDLQALAAALRGQAAASTRLAAAERSPSIASGYRPTCPGSSGPGDGPITRWRTAAAESASAIAAQLENSAGDASEGGRRASAASISYRAAQHIASMDEISTAVEGVNSALAAIDRDGIIAVLTRLEAETSPSGVCADIAMNAGLKDVRKRLGELELMPLKFVPPLPPTERTAIDDLFQQVIAFFAGHESHLGFYAPALVLAPIADLLFMVGLGKMAGPPCPRPEADLAASLAAAIGLPPEDAPLASEAYAAVAQSAEWQAIVSLATVGQRFGLQTYHITIPESDWQLVMAWREQVALGNVRYAGLHEGRHCFVATPKFLTRLYASLARRWADYRLSGSGGANAVTPEPAE